MRGRGPAETLQMREVPSPVGNLRLVASDRGLRAVLWRNEDPNTYAGIIGREIDPTDRPSAILDAAEHQLGEYFAGRRREFDVALDAVGSEFQLAAWRVLSTIPYGVTISYADQARSLGDQRKARAIGGANGRNPIPIIVPCHRVIGSDGSLTGFAAGTDIKKFLLDFEREHVRASASPNTAGSAASAPTRSG